MKSPVDTSFINDLSSLDMLRQQAQSGEGKEDALRSAASQFESIFTQMLFKSMRDANSVFDSGLTDNRTSKFYQQMADEQLSSTLSQQGSLGLAEMIVKQLSGLQSSEPMDVGANTASDRLKLPAAKPDAAPAENEKEQDDKPVTETVAAKEATDTKSAPPKERERGFSSPAGFVTTMLPHAMKAGRALGADPAILLAQAALETGWGQKVIENGMGSSFNLFNIKANRSWDGDKVSTRTLEFENDIPVNKQAAFRKYPSFEESFNDYADFLTTQPRYKDALKESSNPEGFIRGLHKAGYATDPDYSDKVLRVFEQVKSLLK
ncbi:flagellar assembly peptidoglycan hydrolase FlgJ [Veronia nyctiphanis]|uniref:Peptidoglycan hydrolase FlgJ n=1 Tax=Veronia nyctiphanis TaxID=1278244 RepID=A0A4Q0YPF0_9GAMM|nr:flagellar assembly peptidoglycan hydrolase FlgJ [Veronia nyctiphanis]RXJ72900.1 flagellar assembly peptidoglycan hydrolase FlgJ [Veronia nyctiphanis]